MSNNISKNRESLMKLFIDYALTLIPIFQPAQQVYAKSSETTGVPVKFDGTTYVML